MTNTAAARVNMENRKASKTFVYINTERIRIVYYVGLSHACRK